VRGLCQGREDDVTRRRWIIVSAMRESSGVFSESSPPLRARPDRISPLLSDRERAILRLIGEG